MHRSIAPYLKPEIDHKNLNKLDNRKKNIRAVDRKRQMQNIPAQKMGRKMWSEYKGVTKDGLVHRKYELKNPWKARIRVDGLLITLGWYGTEKEAARAYNQAAKRYFGEYAHLNRVRR